MKKLFIAATCALLCAALVAPAIADHKIGGYYRTQGIVSNVNYPEGQRDDVSPKRWVDNRIRAKWTNNINEYVSTVWYVEADFPWGMAGSGDNAGRWSADGVNIETKNAFATVKIPETPATLTVGILGFGDNYHSLVINQDIAGVKLDAKLGMVDVVALWSKAEEGNQTHEDDVDLYWLEGNLKPADNITAGLTGAWIRDQTGSMFPNTSNATGSDNYYVGLNGGIKLDMVDLDGFFVYNFGTNENQLTDTAGNPKDEDIAAWALGLTAKAKLSAIKVGGGLLVMSADDDKDDDNSLNGGVGVFPFYDAGLQIFLADIYYNNEGGRGGGGRLAVDDAGFAGYGLYGLWANAAMDLPAMKGAYVKGAAGYFAAMDDKRNGEATKSRQGTSLGFELTAQVGIKVADSADFSLRGAYAVLGDFYEKTAVNKNGLAADPDDLYKLVLMLNIPY